MSFTLTRDAWKNFKTQNNLSKSPWYSRADVGPTIDKFWAARDIFLKAPGMESLKKFFAAATNLQKAFTKFVGLKEVKGEMTNPAKAQIETWKDQIDDVTKMLAIEAKRNAKQLLEADAKRLMENLKNSGL